MKKAILSIIFLLILSSICLALTVDDNGYAWKAATQDDKIAVCKELSKTVGKDYTYWIDMLNAFYNTTNWNIQSMKIKDISLQIPLLDPSSGE